MWETKVLLIRFKAPYVGGKGAFLFYKFLRPLSVVDYGFYFAAMADNAFILQQAFNVLFCKGGDFFKIKIMKRCSKIFSFS